MKTLKAFWSGYQYRPEETKRVELSVNISTDGRLASIKLYNLNVQPEECRQLAVCYGGRLAKEWSKASTRQYTHIGPTQHDNITHQFVQAKLLVCVRGGTNGKRCTQYQLTDLGREFLKEFL